jgi:hypothetical protein
VEGRKNQLRDLISPSKHVQDHQEEQVKMKIIILLQKRKENKIIMKKLGQQTREMMR